MEPFRFHLFVCTQSKPEGISSCPANGSLQLLQALEAELLSQGLDPEVQVTTCGCLGLCDDGPILIVYPGPVYYRNVRPADIREIVSSHLRDRQPVSRLVWEDAAAIKSTSEKRSRRRQGKAAGRYRRCGSTGDRPRRRGNTATARRHPQ